MSIVITNVGPVSDSPYDDERNYILSIGRDTLATFTHCRDDGLADCLHRAAIAYTKQQIDDLKTEIDAFATTKES